MAFPLDIAFAGGMAYASYRAVGRWLKFADDTNKRADGENPAAGLMELE